MKSIAQQINAQDILLPVDLVTYMYMLISEVFVKTWSNVTTAKIWNLPNFCQFLDRQKIGSKQNWL